MEGIPGNTAYDYTYVPQHTTQTFRQDRVPHFRNGKEKFQAQPPYMQQSISSSPRRSPSVSPPRRPTNYPKYPANERTQYEENQGYPVQQINRYVNQPQANEAPYENPNPSGELNQLYTNTNIQRKYGAKAVYDGDYGYNENESSYPPVGDYVRNTTQSYETIKPAYEELNQVVQDGDYFSIIEDQYSTDEGDGYEPMYSIVNDPRKGGDVMYGEQFDPACYVGQEEYDFQDEEQYEPTHYSASNIPAPPPLPGTENSSKRSYQHCQQDVPKNPMTASCPILSNKMQNLRRKDIFKQVSKKINETVAELRNAGIEEKIEQTRMSNPNLDYIRRHNVAEKPMQRRKPQENAQDRSNFQSKNGRMQSKIPQLQQNQLQFYRHGVKQKQDHPPPPDSYRRFINNQTANENHARYQEAQCREGNRALAQQLNELSKTKTESQMVDSFVQLQ